MRVVIILFLAFAAVFLAACGDDDDATSTPTTARTGAVTGTSAATATGAGAEAFIVSVGLKDYEVIPNPDSGPAGDFEFQVSNTGPSVHEFVVVKTDLAADDLPTGDDGSVEEGGGLEAIGEIEDIAVGSPQTFEASLDAGHYVLFCNIVEEVGGETIAHYTQGMHKDFTVE
jgi:hypothetical protein